MKKKEDRVLSVRIRKASKKFTCFQCGKDIEAGEEYTKTAMIADGEFTTT